MDLNQTSDTISGTYVITGTGTQGNINGTVNATSFTGNLSMTTPAQSGGLCQGSASITGTAGGATMRWTSPGVAQTTCSGMPTNITIAVQRR
jgi:hypothetical protein